MEGKKYLVLGVLCSLVLLVAFAGVVSAKTIFVPDDYGKIQYAVNNASRVDVIIVRDGVYVENVDITISFLTIKSENGSKSCIVKAKNIYGHVFEIKSAAFVKIIGFSVEGATGQKAGICVSGENCVVSNNTCENNRYGIYLLDYSRKNEISNNTCENNRYGIYLSRGSYKNEISNNTCENNTYGIYLYRSDDNEISNDTCKNNDYGIYLYMSDDNKISNDTCKNNGAGIYLYSYSGGNRINRILNNTCENNYYGIYLDQSESDSSVIYLNNFVNNTKNVRSLVSTSIWNSTKPLNYTYKGRAYGNYLGNYWSDYTGSDTNGDGIGDTPYGIDGDKDDYPLIERVENYFPKNQLPIASFKYSPVYPVVVNQTITFNASDSYDPDGTIEKYGWNFGDNTTATGEIVTHSYFSLGNYTVTLTVTDKEGATNTITEKITVLPVPPMELTLTYKDFDELHEVCVYDKKWCVNNTCTYNPQRCPYADYEGKAILYGYMKKHNITAPEGSKELDITVKICCKGWGEGLEVDIDKLNPDSGIQIIVDDQVWENKINETTIKSTHHDSYYKHDWCESFSTSSFNVSGEREVNLTINMTGNARLDFNETILSFR